MMMMSAWVPAVWADKIQCPDTYTAKTFMVFLKIWALTLPELSFSLQ